jgi:hypothetical protein
MGHDHCYETLSFLFAQSVVFSPVSPHTHRHTESRQLFFILSRPMRPRPRVQLNPGPASRAMIYKYISTRHIFGAPLSPRCGDERRKKRRHRHKKTKGKSNARVATTIHGARQPFLLSSCRSSFFLASAMSDCCQKKKKKNENRRRRRQKHVRRRSIT